MATPAPEWMPPEVAELINLRGLDILSAQSSGGPRPPSVGHDWYTEYWFEEADPNTGIFIVQAIGGVFAGAVLLSQQELRGLQDSYNHAAEHHWGAEGGHSHG